MHDFSTTRNMAGNPWRLVAFTAGVLWLVTLIAAIVWFASSGDDTDRAEFSDHIVEQMVNYCSTGDTVDNAACAAFWAAVDSAPGEQ